MVNNPILLHKVKIIHIKMPNMDGMGLANQLLKDYPYIPIIALSGNVEAEDVKGHNFVGFLEKPMQMATLLEMVEEALKSEV